MISQFGVINSFIAPHFYMQSVQTEFVHMTICYSSSRREVVFFILSFCIPTCEDYGNHLILV